MIKEVLAKLAEGMSLSFEEASAFVDAIAKGDVTDGPIAGFLTGLRIKGEQPEELAGCVSALRAHAVSVPHSQTTVFDCCGTGGDGANTFNISTASAIVVAACGVPTAKHGNRAVSSACGSADLLEATGAKIDISPKHSARLLDEIGFCFLFAPLYHPATKRVATVRRELGFRTMFNLMGPLLNPARATHQIIGTSSPEKASLLASVQAHIGGTRMITYSNSLGVDVLLPSGRNILCRWTTSGLESDHLRLPQFLENGFMLSHIIGGDREFNVQLLSEVLSGVESEYSRVTALNAAFGLEFVGKVGTLDDGYRMALDALRTGAAKNLFETYRFMTHEAC